MLKNVYKTYIDVIGYVKTDKKRYQNDNEKAPVNADDDQIMEDGNQDQEMDQALN